MAVAHSTWMLAVRASSLASQLLQDFALARMIVAIPVTLS
jgi:hypothetical protein